MEIVPAPFRHAPEELRRAVREHRRPEWRGWFDEFCARPALMRLWWLDPPTTLISCFSFGAGHLGAQQWIDRGIGIHIRDEVAREQADEYRRQLAALPTPRPAYGYVWMTRVGVMAAYGSHDYLRPAIDAVVRGEQDAFLPVEFVWIDALKATRVRPFLPALP